MQDDNSKTPSSLGMSFSMGQPGSKSILQKKPSIPSFNRFYFCCDNLFPCVIQGHSLYSVHHDQADHNCSFQGWSAISGLWGDHLVLPTYFHKLLAIFYQTADSQSWINHNRL